MQLSSRREQLGGIQAESYPWLCQEVRIRCPLVIHSTLPTFTLSSKSTSPPLYPRAFSMFRDAYTPGPKVPRVEGRKPWRSICSAALREVPWYMVTVLQHSFEWP